MFYIVFIKSIFEHLLMLISVAGFEVEILIFEAVFLFQFIMILMYDLFLFLEILLFSSTLIILPILLVIADIISLQIALCADSRHDLIPKY